MEIALCDFDEKYLDSLLSHLISKIKGQYLIFTSIEDFLAPIMMENRHFDYGLLSKDFYQEFQTRISKADSMELRALGLEAIFNKIIILDSSLDFQAYDNLPTVYKYGSMENLLSYLKPVSESFIEKKAKDTSQYMVCSPTGHELLEIYALSLCQTFSQQGGVLLVDFLPSSQLFSLMNRKMENSLIDIVYCMQSQADYDLENAFEYYSNIVILPGVRNPFDMNQISKEQFEKLICKIDSMGFDRVVYMVEATGFMCQDLILRCDQLFLINRKGDFYRDSREQYRRVLEDQVGIDNIRDIELPMTAANLKAGSYLLEELINGKLGQFVRNGNY